MRCRTSSVPNASAALASMPPSTAPALPAQRPIRDAVAALLFMVVAVPAVIVASWVMVTSFATYNDARGEDHRSADDFFFRFERLAEKARISAPFTELPLG